MPPLPSPGAVSVADFGAAGDGSTDDAAAIQTAFNAACSKGSAVYFPAATYAFKTTLVTGCAMTMYGDGPWASVLLMTAPKSGKFGIVANYSLTVRDMGVNAAASTGLTQSPAVVRCNNTSPTVCPSGPATGQVFVFERYWSSGWNFGLDIAGTPITQVEQVTVRDCVIRVAGANDTVAEAVNVRSTNFLTVSENTLTGSGGNDHLIYLIGVLKVTIRNNVISNNYFKDSAIKIVGGGANAYQDWTVENNSITNIGQAINLYQEGAAMQPSVHVRGNLIAGALDTYQTDAGAINLVAGPGTAFFQSVFIEDNHAANLTLGVITLTASAGCGYNYVYIHNNTFVNWSTLSPGKFSAIAAIGEGSFGRLSVFSLSLDGRSSGRAALNANFSSVEVADLYEVNTTNPSQDRDITRPH